MAFPGPASRRSTAARPAPSAPSAPDTWSFADPAADEHSGSLGALFDSSPEVPARTTPAAFLGLVWGLGALTSSLWSDTLGLTVLLAGLALVSGVVGLAKASRPGVAGGATAAGAVVAALLTGALVALRYAGVDTAVAGDLSLRPAIDWLTALLPAPPV